MVTYLLSGTKKNHGVVECPDLKTIAKVICPILNLSLVQPRLLHDVLDIAGSEHEVGLAGKHGTLEAGDA